MHDRPRLSWHQTLAALACAALTGVSGGTLASAHEGEDHSHGGAVVTQGFFTPMAEEGEGISGFAKLIVHNGQTQLVVDLDGLGDKKAYPAHLHNGHCIEAGPHTPTTLWARRVRLTNCGPPPILTTRRPG